MADTVTNTTIFQSKKRLVVVSQIYTDGTGSTDVVLVDKSALTGPSGGEPGKLVVEEIEYQVDGMQVLLEFEHTTDDPIAALVGHDEMCFNEVGAGFVDPASAGGTGDIVATTVGHTAGDKATIVLYLRKKD